MLKHKREYFLSLASKDHRYERYRRAGHFSQLFSLYGLFSQHSSAARGPPAFIRCLITSLPISIIMPRLGSTLINFTTTQRGELKITLLMVLVSLSLPPSHLKTLKGRLSTVPLFVAKISSAS